MKSFANALFASLALFFAVVTGATAQAPPTHPDPLAVLIGSFTVTIPAGGSATSTFSSRFGASASSAAAEECVIKANVSVWRTSTGQIDYIIDAASVEFVGDCGGVDMSAADIFGSLASAAMAKGIEMNFSPCTPNCSEPGYSRVYSALCVRSLGYGPSRHYVACDASSLCYREYVYCCPNGTGDPQITQIPRQGGGCGAGVPNVCEPTCADGSMQLLD